LIWICRIAALNWSGFSCGFKGYEQSQQLEKLNQIVIQQMEILRKIILLKYKNGDSDEQ